MNLKEVAKLACDKQSSYACGGSLNLRTSRTNGSTLDDVHAFFSALCTAFLSLVTLACLVYSSRFPSKVTSVSEAEMK